MKTGNKVRLAAMAALGVVLAGCGGLGNGVLPVNAVIQPFGGAEGAATSKAFTCINTGLSLLLDFSDGSRGDFSSRATYSSSNPAVARVSNLDIAVPDQTNIFYSRGTILPVAEGTATITVTYLTFTRTIDVTVSNPGNLRITPASGDVAVKALLDFAAVADLDGVETPLDALVQWSIVTPNEAVATISATAGTVTGVAAGSVTARARVPGCDILTADAEVAVANLQSLALSREFGDNDKLVVSTTERLIATGTLDNGKTQDLSTQVIYTSSDSTAVALVNLGLFNAALALKTVTDPVQISATFSAPVIATAPAIGIVPVVDALNSIVISPASVDVVAGRQTQLNATGTFASGATQDITRHVSWASGNTTQLGIQSSSSLGLNGLSGLVTTAAAAAGNAVTVTASSVNGSAQAISSTATVNIQ
ncbi:MAG: hypothetical protein V4650_10785 [Pseudomonadota bacterium]